MRAARHALGLSTSFVASSTGIGIATIKRYEAVNGVPKSRKNHLETLRTFFESQGIEFVGSPDDRPGIRIGSPKPE